jgi:hypothetical protein
LLVPVVSEGAFKRGTGTQQLYVSKSLNFGKLYSKAPATKQTHKKACSVDLAPPLCFNLKREGRLFASHLFADWQRGYASSGVATRNRPSRPDQDS